jgi:hypothetical protein
MVALEVIVLDNFFEGAPLVGRWLSYGRWGSRIVALAITRGTS